MSEKILHTHPWSSMVLVIFLLCLIQYPQISNAITFCQYFKDGQPGIYLKACLYTCCPMNPQARENTTCCNPPPTYATVVTTAYTLFGYSWWTFFLCAVCLFLATSIVVHYYKRIHFLKHFKHFNSMVDPVAAFTISQKDPNINPVCHYSAETNSIVLEQNPPSYAKVDSTPPPPYASMNVSTERVLE